MNPVCCVCKGSQNEESGTMIYYCTCNGGPASAHSACISALVSSGNLAESHICETCSRKILVDKGDCSSLKMSSTLKVAAPRVIDIDLSWKTDKKTPQSNKRAIRRARTSLTGVIKKTPPIETSSLTEDNQDNASKNVDTISVSESEKLGVSILGRRFSDTTINVPIKKRRIPFVPSLLPPPRLSSLQFTEPDCDTEKASPQEPEESLVDPDNDRHVLESHNLPKEVKEVVNTRDSCSSELKTKENVPVQPISPPKLGGDAADFSGLSVLATAACNSGPGSIVHPSKLTTVHFSLDDESMPSIVVNNGRFWKHNEGCDQHEMAYDPTRADVDGRNDFLVSPTQISDGAGSVSKKSYDGDGVYTSRLIHTPSSLLSLNKLPISTQNCEGRKTSGKTESSSTWKDRASWDLNTVMDEWGRPSHDLGSSTGEDGAEKGHVGIFELQQMRVGVGDERQENLRDEKASDHLVQNPAKDEDEAGAQSEGAHCTVSQLHMQLCLPCSYESTANKDLTDCSSSRIDEYAVEISKTVSLEKSGLQDLVLDTKLSEEPVDSGQTCGNCTAEPANIKGLQGAQDDALVTTEQLGVDVKIESNGLSEKICCHFAAAATRIVDKITEPSTSEEISLNEGTVNSHAGLNLCGSCDQGFEPAETSDAQFNNCENNVIIDNSSLPQRKCEGMLEGKGDAVADGVDKHLVTNLGISLAVSEMDRSSDQNPQIPSPTRVVGEENIVKGDTGNVSPVLGIAATSSSDNAVAHCLSLVEKINDCSFVANNLTNECLSDSPGHLEVPLPAEDNGKQVEVRPDISRDGQPSDLRDRISEKNPVCMGAENNLISGDPVSVELSCHSDASRSCNDDHITSLAEDVHFNNYDSDYESDVSPRIEISDMQISDESRGEDDQFEDGEFRSVVHAWDEDTAENVESDPVDFGHSDNRDVNDHIIAVEVHKARSLQVHNVESKGKALLESIPPVISDEPACSANNVKESSGRTGQGEQFQAEGSDTGPGRNRPLKARKVPKSQIDRMQASGKIDNSITLIEGSSQVAIDMDIHLTENDLEAGNSSSPILNTIARSNSPSLCDNSQGPRSTDDINFRRNREDVGPNVHSATGSLRRGGMAVGRELSSQIEVPLSSDADIRKEIHARGSRLGTSDDANQLERSAARGPSVGRGSSMHVPPRRGETDWLDPPGEYWNRNSRRSPIYYDQSDFSRPVSASAKLPNSDCVTVPDGTVVRAGRMGDMISRQTTSLRSLHGAPMRRGSPTDQDEDLGFDIQLGIESAREISPHRVLNVNRERSRGYGPRVLRLNPRERYEEEMEDGRIGSSIHMDRAVRRRERSFSPGRRRISPLGISSHAKSPRRSRTRSPRIWTSRRRNEIGLEEEQGLRRRTRSPDFRSDVRIDRTKSPQRRSIFVEHMDGFFPTSHNHSPPPRVSRWIDERRVVGQFREHEFRRAALDRSPSGRVFTRGRHRYDLLGSPRRVRADEYFRSLHSDRSPELDVDFREPRYDISEDEERKHGDRYVGHPVRPFSIDGDGRRFRYELGDGYRSHGSRGNPVEFHRRGSLRDSHRAIESRLGDPSRRVSSRGHFSYDREGRNKQNFRLLEVSDDDLSSRRRRP